MVKVEGEYAGPGGGVRVGIMADKRLESSPLHFMAVARMSDLEVVNFNGFGNATIDSGATSSYFDVHQRQWLFHPMIALAVGSGMDVSLGPVIQHSVADSARNRYLSATRPYGFGSFNEAGVQLGARYEWLGVRLGGWHSRTGEGLWFGRDDASPVVIVGRTKEPGHAGVHIRFGLNF